VIYLLGIHPLALITGTGDISDSVIVQVLTLLHHLDTELK